MGIQVEFNPDLCLRAFETQGRKIAECLPEKLEPRGTYGFLKRGQRIFWFGGEMPLWETRGAGPVGRILASIVILEATHFRGEGGEIWTKGHYEVGEVYDASDLRIHFEGFVKR